LMSLSHMAYFLPMLLGLRYTALKGRSARAQTIFIWGFTALLTSLSPSPVTLLTTSSGPPLALILSVLPCHARYMRPPSSNTRETASSSKPDPDPSIPVILRSLTIPPVAAT